MNKLKTDKFRKSRGGYSRLLNVACRKCGNNILIYQKDGPGSLRRLYFDRIFSPERLVGLQKNKIGDVGPLKCGQCKEILGTPYVYKKESRKAFRLYQDAVVKKVRRL
jgi:hypothetical protein